jgi:hypothetical protein
MQILLWHWNSPVHCNQGRIHGGRWGRSRSPGQVWVDFFRLRFWRTTSNCVITCYVHQQNYTKWANCMLWKGISCQDTSCKGLMKASFSASFRWNNRCVTHMVLVHRVLHGNAPKYLGPLTRLSDVPSRSSPRSASSNHLLIPSIRRSTVGARAFPVSGPALLNSLPADIMPINSLSVFRRRLRNYFYPIRIQALFNNCTFSIVA